MNRLQLALERIQFTRKYTLGLLNDIKPEDWFRQPSEGVSHLAWQVGHLAVAQYALAMRVTRGVQPSHEGLVPREYFPLFGRGSVVDADPQKYPSPQELREIMDRVHSRVPEELALVGEEELDQPPTTAHPAYSTKFEALMFCSEHEMVHAGQIGLLRRLFGYAPVR